LLTWAVCLPSPRPVRESLAPSSTGLSVIHVFSSLSNGMSLVPFHVAVTLPSVPRFLSKLFCFYSGDFPSTVRFEERTSFFVSSFPIRPRESLHFRLIKAYKRLVAVYPLAKYIRSAVTVPPHFPLRSTERLHLSASFINRLLSSSPLVLLM